MDTSTIILAVIVGVSVIGQAALILISNARRKAEIDRLSKQSLAKARADLVETAADLNSDPFVSHSDSLVKTSTKVSHE